MREKITLDGNEAAARIAYASNEVIAIYPITPSSPMGEWADQWAFEHRTNIWGTVPRVIEMQSEGGAAGALHGALQAGCLSTTFTSSQGLLLMIPNMYKIAGELTPTVFHVAARSLAAQGLSIFGDQSDVMAVRQTGFAMLASGSVQEVMDLALIAHAATLESRVPFLHFFDGFRTSHEVNKIEKLNESDVRTMINQKFVLDHRARALSPDHPFIRGTAQNPDVYFQARESVNPFYLACPTVVQNVMDRFAALAGRQYHLFDYSGAPDAERVLILMGSGCETVEEFVRAKQNEEKIGLLKVRLFRPFSVNAFLSSLPSTVQAVAVLDRTKEPGSAGEPLYQDVVTAFAEAGGALPKIIGGRYGLSSKEFTPAMVKAIFDELQKGRPKNHFTIGIHDDVTHTSLPFDATFSTEDPATTRALFYGLGADGTVGANKNSIKIIGEETADFAQGYFVYDSKKSGSVTISHLRFGPRLIRSAYLISRANFIGCHQFGLIEKLDVLSSAEPTATFLLNSPYDADSVWQHLPDAARKQIIEKQLKFYVIDAYKIAKEAGLGGRMNTILQTCFFALSNVLPQEQALMAIKKAIQKTYGSRGASVVQKNLDAVDQALMHLVEVKVPEKFTGNGQIRSDVLDQAPEFVRNVTAQMMRGQGDALPVSAMPCDGTFPSGTAKWEKRDIATQLPVWDEQLCIQCGKCVLVCPHATIRATLFEKERLQQAPATFQSAAARWREFSDLQYTLQVAPEDCTGCSLCVEVCPVKSKTDPDRKAINMAPHAEVRDRQKENWDFFLELSHVGRESVSLTQIKDVQLLEPLFEFSGACAGCGETPYLKLLTQLFGDRLMIANATGCSSIYGGNLPTTPWTCNQDGRGPAWSNSLFEDNAEFGLGMRLAIDKQSEYARSLLQQLSKALDPGLVEALLNTDQNMESGIHQQRQQVRLLKEKLETMKDPLAAELFAVADTLVKKSVWIVGGDGWAYDIGFGGLDHVVASGQKVNLLVLDTEVYSNTGGQMSKATPRGAVAKFASGGKASSKKDLAAMIMNYGNVYVARVAMGGNDSQTLKAFMEAEAYPGPSIIIAYAHCIAHGYDLVHGLEQQKSAVLTGYWPLFRYNPLLREQGKNPLQLDSKAPSQPLKSYAYKESRYTMLANKDPQAAEEALRLAQQDVDSRWRFYEQLASLNQSIK